MQIRTQRRFNPGMEKDMPVSSSRTLAQRLNHKGVAEVQRIFAKDMIRAIIFH
jgi:hypothetical protein